MAGFDVGSVYGGLKLETGEFRKSVTVINKGQTAMTKKAGGTSSAFKGLWKQMAVGLGVGALVALAMRSITRQFSDTIQKGREFEKEWANVTTMLSISSEETDNMRQELLRLSPTLGDTTDLAKGMYQVLSASIEPAKAIEFLGEAAKAAKAGITEVNTAVDALTTVINAYGLSAEDVTDVSDIMFQTVKRGKLTFGELSNALGTVVPVAATVGVEFDEVAAAISALTRQGIDAGTATMQLRQVFMAILKPSDQALKKAEELGIEWNVAALEAKGLGGFLAEVKEKTKGNTEAMATLVPNVRALTGVMVLAGEASEGFEEDLLLVADASGSTEEAFRKQMKSVDFWIETMKTSIDKFKIAFWDGFTDPLKEGIKSSEDLEKATQELITTFQELGKLIGSVVVPAYQGLMKYVNKAFDLNKKMKLLIEGVALAIKNKQIPTLKNVTNAWVDNYTEQKKAKEWADKNKESIAKLIKKLTGLKIGLGKTKKELDKSKKGSKDLGDTIDDKLIPPLKELAKATETWKDFLHDLSIKTIPENKRRVELLKDHIKELDRAYKDGIISLEDYKKATKAARDEIEELSPAVTWTAIPAFRNMAGVLDQAVGEMEDRIPDVTEAIEIEAKEINRHWDNLMTNLGTAYGNFAFDILSQGSDLNDALDGLWLDILYSFKAMIADMVTEWATNFIKEILSTTSSAEAAAALAASTGTGAGATAGAAAGTTAGTATGSAFSTALAGAALFTLPLLMIPIARWLDKIFPKHIKTAAELAAMEATRVFRESAKEWSKIAGTYEEEWKKGKITTGEEGEGWATGFEGVVTKPMRPLIGEVPEYVNIQPLSKMRTPDMITSQARSKTEVNLTIRNDFFINNQVDPNFTQQYVEKSIMPEMMNKLETGVMKTRLKEILGVSG